MGLLILYFLVAYPGALPVLMVTGGFAFHAFSHYLRKAT